MSSSSSPPSSEQDIFADVLPKLVATIRASSSLAAQDVNFYKSVDSNLAEDIDASAKRLMNICNDLIRVTDDTSETKMEFGQENITSDVSWNPIGNVLDSIFEKIDYAFDQATKKSVSKAEGKSLEYLDDGSQTTSGNEPGKRTTKPQLKFKTPIDNSESHPFKPKLKSKPHALISFEETLQLKNPKPKYEDSIEVIDPPFYPQPYEYEIDNQPYPDAILEATKPIPSKDWSSTTAIWVDTPEELTKMIDSLKGSTEIAVDLEHHDYRTYYGLVCLMQISNREQDWIVDTLALRDELSELNIIFADPQIVKVFHGAFMDIIWLQRDLGLYVVSLFDTYCASKVLGFPKFSLAYLLETFANFKTSKKYQLADWRIRPLSPPMLAYARSDTHFLLNIYDQLRNKLIEKDNGKLQEVLYDSRQVAKRRFEYTKYRPLTNNISNKVSCPVMSSNPREPYNNLMYQYNVPAFKKPVVEVLYKWRDLIAKQEDESVRYIMPNQLLVTLANLDSPVDTQKVLNVPHYVSESVRLHAKELAELIDKTLKHTEASDWDLVDKWNNPSVNTTNDALDIHDTKELSKATDMLSNLIEINGTLLNNQIPQLLVNESKMYSNIYTSEKPHIMLEFDMKKNAFVKHNFEEVYQERLQALWDGLKELGEHSNVLIPEEEIDQVEEDVEVTAEASQPAPTTTTKPTLFPQDKEIDPNELITLRKRRPQPKKTGQAAQEEEEAPSVDYANADKIMITSKNKRGGKQNKNKKRAFDPYGKESEGPKPAKRAKTVTTGKTSTFKNKRK
ncbi:RRP6 [[Candida] subhashii]|uniref:RRP6 n=1 Tax=[Candida] subhashii TaxID=561895 RepID=A0A8J5QBV5_9ASCO|nr:RRP6 [[Candida] subhashii]KAG7660732.1 RRP6 [[Candida] subhashii]